MIGRRGLILLASSLALSLCASCSGVKEANDMAGGDNDNVSHAVREHISRDRVAGVFLFSLDGQSISEINGDNLRDVVETLSNLDSATSEEPAVVPDGGSSGGRDCMFFVVFESSETLTVGTDGSCAIYDSVSFESSYAACQRTEDLYSRLIETTS